MDEHGEELAPSTPGAGDTIAEPSSSPGGQPLMTMYVAEAERYQEERYGTSFCIKDTSTYVVKQCTPQEGDAFIKDNEAYAVTYVKLDTGADQAARMTAEISSAMSAMAGPGMVATGAISTEQRWLRPTPTGTVIVLVSDNQKHRVAHPTTVTTAAGIKITMWTRWNPKTTAAVVVAEPATVICTENMDLARITTEQKNSVIKICAANGAPHTAVSMAGKQVAWGGEVEKMTSAMAKLWATEESMNALEAAGITNRRLEGEIFIFTDKRKAVDLIKENQQPLQAQRRKVKHIASQLDRGHATVELKWNRSVEEPAEATNEWLTRMGLACGGDTYVAGTAGQVAVIKVPEQIFNDLMRAKLPSGASSKRLKQPSFTAKDLDEAQRELQRLEHMAQAVAHCTQNQIDAVMTNAAVQQAIQLAAATLSEATYGEQRETLITAMRPHVQNAALQRNAKRAAEEVSGHTPEPKRAAGGT